MLDHVNHEASNSNNLEVSWKSVTKGKRSKKPVARNVNEITKVANISPKKFDGFVTIKQVSNRPDHIPPKKVHGPLLDLTPCGIPGPQSFARPHKDPLSPQSQTSSPHGDFKIQSKGLSKSSVTNSKADSAGFPYVLNQKLYNPEDFSGIALLAAAACIDGIDDTNQFKGIEQHPIPKTDSVSASIEPIKCSVSIENESSPIDTVKESTDAQCSSLANGASRSESMQVNEDVVVNELKVEKVDRLYWDLNLEMDAWEKPFEDSAGGAPLVAISDQILEVEKLEGEECNVSLKDCTEGIDFAISGSFQHENEIDNVTTASADEMSSLRDSSGNNFTPKGHTNNISAPDTTVIEQLALPFPSKKDDESPSCNLSSCSAKACSSPGNCRLDVSQGDSSNTVGSKDITGLQDGNESPYEDGELRLSIPCLWEDNKFDYEDNECVDYESDGVDYPGSEVVEGGSDGSLGVEKQNLSVTETSISELNPNGSLKNCLKEEVGVGGIMAKSSGKMGDYMRENNLGRRHSSYHLGGIETKGSHLKEMYSRTNKLKSQSLDECSEYMDVMENNSTGYLQQNNRSRIYSRPIRDVNPQKFMGRHRSPFHVRERNGEGDQWGSRSHMSHGPGGPKYYKPKHMTSDFEKISGFNSEVNRQSMNYSSKASHQADNRRLLNEMDDYFCVQRRTPANTDRSSANSGSYIQGVSRGNRNEFYDPSHEKRALPSSRMPRFLSKRGSPSPPSGRFSQSVITRRRSHSRSRSRSPYWWRRDTRPNFTSQARVDGERASFQKPSFPADHPGNARRRYPPQRNSRWVDDHNVVKNPRNRKSPESASERIFRYNSISSNARYKEDNYHRPGNRPRRFSPIAGAGRGCNFSKKYDDRRDDRVDADVVRYKHDPEDNFDDNVTRKDDVRNTERRYVGRSFQEDRRSFKI